VYKETQTSLLSTNLTRIDCGWLTPANYMHVQFPRNIKLARVMRSQVVSQETLV